MPKQFLDQLNCLMLYHEKSDRLVLSTLKELKLHQIIFITIIRQNCQPRYLKVQGNATKTNFKLSEVQQKQNVMSYK